MKCVVNYLCDGTHQHGDIRHDDHVFLVADGLVRVEPEDLLLLKGDGVVVVVEVQVHLLPRLTGIETGSLDNRL